ncbi:MAG: hypothetical protein EBU66_09445 [Bacteroidetes bacterium]|nr:hypothetical protein [bacterium]NBP64867.1 hypothetical protein [Bacteroidota bacterium]
MKLIIQIKHKIGNYLVIIMRRMLENLEASNNPFVETSIKRSLADLYEIFRGQRLMRHLAPNDWPIMNPSLYFAQVVVVGGFNGNLVRKLLNNVPSINSIHIYEPVREFSEGLISISPKIQIFNEAVFESNGAVTLAIAGDHTFTKETQRTIDENEPQIGTRVVPSVSFSTLLRRLDPDAFTLVMNCEGAEYEILGQVCSSNKRPSVLIFQTHTVGDRSFQLLYETRAQLAKFYYPLINFNFAWDIWVSKEVYSPELDYFESPLRNV